MARFEQPCGKKQASPPLADLLLKQLDDRARRAEDITEAYPIANFPTRMLIAVPLNDYRLSPVEPAV